MLSLERTDVAVVTCCATPAALDSLAVVPGAYKCRVAPDELMLLAPPTLGAEAIRQATRYLAAREPIALVLDQSDGWSMFTLRGDEAPFIFAQLSVVPLPAERPAFVQGAVAGGSAKMLLVNGAIHMLVPSTLRHHVAARLHDVCGDRTTVAAAAMAFAPDPSTTPPSEYGAVPQALR